MAKVVQPDGSVLTYPYATDDGLRYYDEYEISVKIGKSFVALEVTIDDWAVIQGGVEV